MTFTENECMITKQKDSLDDGSLNDLFIIASADEEHDKEVKYSVNWLSFVLSFILFEMKDKQTLIEK